MADETPAQILNHRNQLKTENDRLNPEVDGLIAKVRSLEPMAAAAEKAQADAVALRAELATITADRDRYKQLYDRKVAATSGALKLLLDEAQQSVA